VTTSDLIDLLVQDDLADRPQHWALFGAMLTGLVAALILTGTLLGFRPTPALASIDVMAKLTFTVSILMLVIPALLRNLRPGSAAGWRWLLPLIVVVAGALASAVEVRLAPQVAVWRPDVPFCLAVIPLFSVPALCVIARAARLQAPTHLPNAGLSVGLASGALSASAYALHCPNDDPLYLVTWYLPAVLISGLIGRTLGPRLLAW